MTEERNKLREDSLIKEFEVLSSDRGTHTHKIVLTTVRGSELNYYTNSDSFIESLKKLAGSTFVITYHTAELTIGNKDIDTRIVRVKLPKSVKK